MRNSTIATLTSKAQITLPKGIRELLRLEPGDKVDFRPLPNGRVTAAKAARVSHASFATLRGLLLLTPKGAYSVKEMRQAVKDTAAARAESVKRGA